MNLVNTTTLVVGYTMATDKTGRESLVVVAKGTYGIPEQPDLEPVLLQEQVPLVTTDTHTGDPASSAVTYELDFAPHKPRCDVLLNGSCYAPEGKPATRVEVGLRVGPLVKGFRVVGPRTYKKGIVSCRPTDPAPFTVMPISYECAYGGVDRTHKDAAKHRWYPLNHVGVGYHSTAGNDELDGQPLPNTEQFNDPVMLSNGSYIPMAFGPLARAWQQRIRWAGTYDQQWLDKQYPFLPEDFDPRYFQSAPDDQQIAPPQGGEQVALKNLSPQGWSVFRLPQHLNVGVVFCGRDGNMTEVASVVDTIILEPDLNRFMLVWRASIPIRRNIREITQVVVGRSARQLADEAVRKNRIQGKRVGTLAENVEWFRRQRQNRATDKDGE